MKAIALIILSINLIGMASAQQTGKVEYKELGLSFNIPDGWVGQEAEGMYIMGHNSIPGMIFVIPHEQKLTTDQMIAESQQGLDFGGGSYLKPSATVSKLSNSTIGGPFNGVIDGSNAKAYVTGIANPYGYGLSVIAVTTPESYNNTYQSLAMQVSNSVQFSKPVVSKESKGEMADWNYQLGGTKLTWMESYSSGGLDGGGYNMKTEIHLCKAGFFLFYDKNFTSMGNVGGYSSGSSNGDGKWEIIKSGGVPYLILHFKDGKKNEYKLEWGEDSKLFLNGYRYYRTWDGENAPDCG